MQKRPPRIHRTLKERLVLYARARELQSRGLEPKEIARTLGISSDQKSDWLTGQVPKREEYVPDLIPSPDLAYLIGAYFGDGRTAGQDDKKVRFKVANREFANSLNELVARILRTIPKAITIEKGFYCANYDSAVLYDFLQESLKTLLPWIEKFPEAFLRGLFDAEGYVSAIMDHKRRTISSIVIGLANSNIEYLTLARKILRLGGIASSLNRTNQSGMPMTIRGRTYIRKNDVYHLRFFGAYKARHFS